MDDGGAAFASILAFLVTDLMTFLVFVTAEAAEAAVVLALTGLVTFAGFLAVVLVVAAVARVATVCERTAAVFFTAFLVNFLVDLTFAVVGGVPPLKAASQPLAYFWLVPVRRIVMTSRGKKGGRGNNRR